METIKCRKSPDNLRRAPAAVAAPRRLFKVKMSRNEPVYELIKRSHGCGAPAKRAR